MGRISTGGLTLKKGGRGKSNNDKGGLTRIEHKPRHGLRMKCRLCGWTFRGGGYETKKKAQEVEKEQKQLHDSTHGDNVLRTPTLEIQRDYHAAEITHYYIEKASTTSAETTTSTSYVDVPGTTVAASNFTANQDHLVFVTAQVNTSLNNRQAGIRMVRGTTPTVIADSESNTDPPVGTTAGLDTTQRMLYNWWGIINTPTAEQLKMQFKSSNTDTTVTVDLISISVIRLSPDLTLNTDYKHSLVTANTNLDVANTDTISNNATVSIQPDSNNHRWLILSKARYGSGIVSTTGVNSRIERSGGATNSAPMMQYEGEDSTTSTNMIYILMGLRTDTLTNTATHTYTEISKAVNTGTGSEGVSAVRTHSGILMLNMDKFKNVATKQEDTPTEEFGTTTDYGYLIETQNIAPTQTGDVFVISHVTLSTQVSGTSDRWSKTRMQINNADQPPEQTSKAYRHAWWDAADRLPVVIQSIENLSAATHTIDLDGSLGEVGTNRGTYTRNITAFTMEMSAATLSQVRPETVSINEGVVYVKGRQLVKIVNEIEGIGESASKHLGTSSNFLSPSNFQLRLSGGVNNTDPNLSLGGARSDVTTPAQVQTADYDPEDYQAEDYITEDTTITGTSGIITAGTRLFDNVSIAEAQGGDPTPDHRCFYVYNSHTTLTMQQLRIWIPDNTEGDDYVEIGLGNSAIGTATVESAIVNEGTPPSPAVTFTQAPSRDNALVIGNLPPLNHKAIWIRRTVPAGTNNPKYNNYYSIMAEFITDHIA